MHMLRQQPHIIGIAGGSCTGKTWLADHLQQALGQSAVRLSLDDFYLDRAYLSAKQRTRINFDHPRAIDWEEFERVLRDFSAGKASRVPRYDFVTHSRSGLEGPVDARALIIIEGLWLFHRVSIRNLFSLKIFISGSEALCESRRLVRDMTERGRTREQVLEQWHEQTRPMYDKFVAPQQSVADVVLEAPVKQSDVEALLNGIATRRNAAEVVGI
jgi:uridine kinase